MKGKLSQLARSLGGWAWAVPYGLFLAACSDNHGGDVMIVVTTDMSLPSDMGWVSCTVKHSGYSDQYRQVPLTTYQSLPGTFALVSGKAGETVSVLLEGRIGDKTGPVRVSRQADFSIPATGLKMLKMPLNWLCSSDVLPGGGCAPGSTCRAGQCVSPEITEPLADYVPLAPAKCFDVHNCTLTGVPRRVTPPNGDADHCFTDGNTVLDAPMNVALEINTDVAGNAGVCVASSSDAASSLNPASGHCFVPLNQDESPDGWQRATNENGQPIIQLPGAVCDAFKHSKLEAVALTHSDCQPKTIERTLCDADPACVLAPSSCPDTLPPGWSGYSCSGAKSPSDDTDSGLSFCGVTDNDPDGLLVARGHLCCTAGQAPSTNPRLIDDMSGGPLIKLSPPSGESAGNWFTASDDTDSPLTPPQKAQTLFVYRVIPAVTPAGADAPTISRAACFRMREGFVGNYAEEGFSFFSKAAAAVPLDVTQYTGITFWAEVTPLGSEPAPDFRVTFPDGDTDTEHGSSCAQTDAGRSGCNAFGKPLSELSPTWQKFSVRWGELTQAGDFGIPFPNFDYHVYSVNFEALGSGGVGAPFDFCVSQIYFSPMTP